MIPVERVSSTVACPSWCALPPGHDYEDFGLGDGLARSHERIAAVIGSVSIELTQYEASAGASGPIDRRPPDLLLQNTITTTQVDLVRPTPDDLRALAAALTDLAVQIED